MSETFNCVPIFYNMLLSTEAHAKHYALISLIKAFVRQPKTHFQHTSPPISFMPRTYKFCCH